MRSVVVTGAAGGIGRATCTAFADAGFRVIGIDVREDADLPCELLPFDVRDFAGSGAACEEICSRIQELSKGSLDALVNNAALQLKQPIEQATPEDWDAILQTNLLAPFWATRRLLPLLRAAKGCVVNMASIHAYATKPGFTLYATSKGALVTLTRAMALELAPDVRVNAVLPAATDTPMLRAGLGNQDDVVDSIGRYHPLGRIAEAAEVARAALFLAGPDSSFITGAELRVDGGIGACLHDPEACR
ncbi:MAG: SDR family oxidoreductase [Myxococcales bacterium]|nr:SDR family oxidoreductase [Myxococcales bacterium]